MTVSLEDIQDKLIPISAQSGPTHVIAPLAPSQDTTPDQIAYFNRPNAIPFVRHSPLPAAANAQVNATAAATAKTVAQSVLTNSGRIKLSVPPEFIPIDQTVSLPGPLELAWAPQSPATYLGVPSGDGVSNFVDKAWANQGLPPMPAPSVLATTVSTAPSFSPEYALWFLITSFASQTNPLVPDDLSWTLVDNSTISTLFAMKAIAANTVTANENIVPAPWASQLVLFGSTGVAPQLIQQVGFGGGSIAGATWTANFPNPVTAGSLIVIWISSLDVTATTIPIPSGSDTDGNGYFLVAQSSEIGQGSQPAVMQQILVTPPAIHTGSTNTITIVIPPTGGGGLLAGQLFAYEISGLASLPTTPRFIPITVEPPLPIKDGGTGTSTPGLVAGSGITITGTWPNETIASASGGPGGVTQDIQVNDAGGFGDAASIVPGSTFQVDSGSTAVIIDHLNLSVSNGTFSVNTLGTGGITLRSTGGNIDINTTSALNQIRIGTANNSNVQVGGGSSNLGFYNGTQTAQQTVTGSRSGGAALTNLLTALAAFGLIVDSTTP